jgi:hypothetical protein
MFGESRIRVHGLMLRAVSIGLFLEFRTSEYNPSSAVWMEHHFRSRHHRCACAIAVSYAW